MFVTKLFKSVNIYYELHENFKKQERKKIYMYISKEALRRFLLSPLNL